tara:strand:+ start:1952 stop:2641 length:690 start_codon:yes stop_codon:yes gene_type:complete
MSELKVNKITDVSGNTVLSSDSSNWTLSAVGTNLTVNQINASGGITASGGTLTGSTITNSTISNSLMSASTNVFPTGHILQVKSVSMGDALSFTPTSQTWTDIAGLSVQITPSSNSNKIMVFCSVNGGGSVQNVACFLRTYRDSTAVGIGNTSSSRSRVSGQLKETTSYDLQSSNWNFLDSPNIEGTAITYKIMVYSNGTVYINRPTTTADNWSVGVTQSSITLMEIQG